MNQDDAIAIYEAATTLLSLSILVVAAIVFWLQFRTYRRTHHPSLIPLLTSTALTGVLVLLSMLARHYWLSGPLGLYLFLISLPVAFIQMALGTYGTAKLLLAFEGRSANGDRFGT
ncbi:MAG: hypothetical protein ACN6RK_03935 [Stenotrophomonas sp.]